MLTVSLHSSPEKPFIAVTKGNTSLPSEAATFATNSGPFGYINNNNYTNNAAYEQIQWLKNDLANVDRSQTPWIFAMSHRPMCASSPYGNYSSVHGLTHKLFLVQTPRKFLPTKSQCGTLSSRSCWTEVSCPTSTQRVLYTVSKPTYSHVYTYGMSGVDGYFAG